METKIAEYEERIDVLEKKVLDLEKRNAGLRECLVRNVHFSTKLSEIIYEMDNLLERKGQEIRDLEMKLEQSLTKTIKSEPSHSSGRNDCRIDIEDFDIDMSDDIVNEDATALNSEALDDDYVEVFPSKKENFEKDLNGYYKCSYKTKSPSNIQRHYRTHTNEKRFGCKLCGKRYTVKNSCLYHIRTHDDRLKVKCSICNAMFAEPKKLIKHTEELHDGKGYDRKRRNPKRKQEAL